jgi:hypothetical protein
MIISLVLALLVTASGTITTYLYDENAPLASRLCVGACVGLAGLGLIGFVFASFLGLTPLAIGLTLITLSSPFLLLRNPIRRRKFRRDLTIASQAVRRTLLHPSCISLGYFLFYAVASVILWRVFDRAMIEIPEGIYTGLLNNFGDLPFHLSVITSFAYGDNFPPEDPTFAGVRFTYPFLSDFISAIFVRCGASLRQSMFLENFMLALSLVGLLHRWALEMLRDRLAAIITPVLVLLNGGFGWVLLWQQAKANEQGLWGLLKNLPPSFTVIPETTWRWGNAISALLVPQRGILLGLPLAVIVFTQWWLAGVKPRGQEEAVGDNRRKGEKGKGKGKRDNQTRSTSASVSNVPLSPAPLSLSRRRMIAAGVVAGLLPLAHAHSFVVVMGVGAFIALFHGSWRNWVTFFFVASVLALPQMWWSTHGSAVNSASFFAWQFGWDHGKENITWFWLKNTGIFIPLLVAAILWRGKDCLVPRKLLLFYLPFSLCFLIPNMIRMAPWVWDNIKVLFYWWVASAPLVALLLARLWHRGGIIRALAVALLICVTLAGGLDVASIVVRQTKYQVFNASGIQFAEVIKLKTDPRALIVHAPVHNHPVFLTGRRSLMGYPGHIWTHGLDFVQREGEVKRIYAGTPEAEVLIKKYGIAYAVVGPLEHNVANVNQQFFLRFAKVGEVGEYSLYKITQP